MIISDNLLDNITHSVNSNLNTAGIDLSSTILENLNENMAQFFSSECDITVQPTVLFNDLRDDQFMAWMEAARTQQTERGLDSTLISSEETERQAKAIFELNEGVLPTHD